MREKSSLRTICIVLNTVLLGSFLNRVRNHSTPFLLDRVAKLTSSVLNRVRFQWVGRIPPPKFLLILFAWHHLCQAAFQNCHQRSLRLPEFSLWRAVRARNVSTSYGGVTLSNSNWYRAIHRSSLEKLDTELIQDKENSLRFYIFWSRNKLEVFTTVNSKAWHGHLSEEASRSIVWLKR